jgi:hypothetical protein
MSLERSKRIMKVYCLLETHTQYHFPGILSSLLFKKEQFQVTAMLTKFNPREHAAIPVRDKTPADETIV